MCLIAQRHPAWNVLSRTKSVIQKVSQAWAAAVSTPFLAFLAGVHNVICQSGCNLCRVPRLSLARNARSALADATRCNGHVA